MPQLPRARPRALRSFLGTLVIVAGVELLVMILLSQTSWGHLGWGMAADVVLLALISAPLLWVFIVRPLWRDIDAGNAVVRETQQRLRTRSAVYELNSQVLRALDMAADEDEVIEVARRTLAVVTPDRGAQILMADSSRAHLRQVLGAADSEVSSCGVQTPAECPAVRGGHPLVFDSGTDIDACPRLRDRSGAVLSAVCLPVSVLGRAAGVMHVVGPASDPPDPVTVEQLQSLGAGVGSRLSMVRALADSQVQAQVDPLTGLLNRRSLEDRIAEMDRAGRGYAVVTFDLDHFKNVNDTYGHAAGDQALRVFARALRETARGGDLVARYGGEEFVVVLPDTTGASAAALADRVRMHLVALLSAGTVPSFTVSAGVADTALVTGFENVLGAADASLFIAKAQGRDRVEVATYLPVEPAAHAESPDSTTSTD